MTDREICDTFQDSGDFIRRELKIRGMTLYAYAIDGLVSGGDMSDFVLKPITYLPAADEIEALYQSALEGGIYNAVAVPAEIAWMRAVMKMERPMMPTTMRIMLMLLAKRA
mgnify:CR=1 FL=1